MADQQPPPPPPPSFYQPVREQYHPHVKGYVYNGDEGLAPYEVDRFPTPLVSVPTYLRYTATLHYLPTYLRYATSSSTYSYLMMHQL